MVLCIYTQFAQEGIINSNLDTNGEKRNNSSSSYSKDLHTCSFYIKLGEVSVWLSGSNVRNNEYHELSFVSRKTLPVAQID